MIYLYSYILGAIIAAYTCRRLLFNEYNQEVEKNKQKGAKNPQEVSVCNFPDIRSRTVKNREEYVNYHTGSILLVSIVWPVVFIITSLYFIFSSLFEFIDKLVDNPNSVIDKTVSGLNNLKNKK